VSNENYDNSEDVYYILKYLFQCLNGHICIRGLKRTWSRCSALKTGVKIGIFRFPFKELFFREIKIVTFESLASFKLLIYAHKFQGPYS